MLPFLTRAQANAAGLTDRAVRHRLASGAWVRARPGLYLPAREAARWPPATVAIAAALHVLEGVAVASHESAAVLHRLELLRDASPSVRLTCPDRSLRRRLAGVHVSTASLPPRHVTTVHGLPITTVARAVVDLARRRPFRDGVALADSALRQGLVHIEELEQLLRDCHTWPGIRAAARVVAFADGRAESVQESLARVVFREQGLPAPELQVWLGDDDGRIGRADFYWRAYGTLAETDGRVKYAAQTRDELWREKRRQERLENAGFKVVRVAWAELHRHPQQVAARIRAAFARSARPVA